MHRMLNLPNFSKFLSLNYCEFLGIPTSVRRQKELENIINYLQAL